MAVQMLYQSDLGEAPVEQVIDDFNPAEDLREGDGGEGPNGSRASSGARRPRRAGRTSPAELAEAFDYARSLVRGARAHLAEIDALIKSQADNWRLERMPAVDRNVLRLAVYEFLFETDVPKLVVLDEAIELAKKFGSEQSGRFVNGLLDGLLKTHEFPGSLT